MTQTLHSAPAGRAPITDPDLDAPQGSEVDALYWVVTMDGVEVCGPFDAPEAAATERDRLQRERRADLLVVPVPAPAR